MYRCRKKPIAIIGAAIIPSTIMIKITSVTPKYIAHKSNTNAPISLSTIEAFATYQIST